MSDLQIALDSQGSEKSHIRKLLGSMLPPMIISGLFPLVIFLLASPRMQTLPALALSAVPAMLYSVYGGMRHHSIDPISALSLVTSGAAMLITLLVHDPGLYLIRESYVMAAIGLFCLISLVFPRPASFYVGRYTIAYTPKQIAYFNAGWQLPSIRFISRLITGVWGLAFIGEALTETFLVYHLSTAQFLAIHPIAYWGTLIAAMGLAIAYAHHAWKHWLPALKKAKKLRREENKQTLQTTTR